MNYLELSVDTWALLKAPDIECGGYPSITLRIREGDTPFLHLFRDGSGKYHFAIEAEKISKKDIEDPHVNGLLIQLASYKFENGNICQFIDLTCSISAYLKEFTEIVREISRLILEEEERPLNAVKQTINNWVSFWANKRKQILSEEEQVGLISELIMLNHLCEINPRDAIKTWVGPLGEKHDFNFSDWSFEVKGTRKSQRIHKINGIDQLKPPFNKNLAFISFQLTTSDNIHSLNIPNLINTIAKKHFYNNPDLILRFNDLLAGVGYSPIHDKDYKLFNVEVTESDFFIVDKDFPKLTSDMLKVPQCRRVSSVNYEIEIGGLKGIALNEIVLENYFY